MFAGPRDPLAPWFFTHREISMPNIRHVCISDLHLGQDASFLTNLANQGQGIIGTDPSEYSPVLSALAPCLSFLTSQNDDGTRPTLVLLGDILELALATMEVATVYFGQFLSLVMKPGAELFSDIVFVPGNHDHHLWELTRTADLVENYSSLGSADMFRFPELPGRITPVWDKSGKPASTDLFMTRVLQGIAQDPGKRILTYYPTFGLYDSIRRRAVLFTHGHYFQGSNYMVSNVMGMLFPDLPAPETVREIETQNFAWVDFVYSMLGRSGKAGKRVEEVYFKLRDSSQVRKMARNYVEALFSRYDLPEWPKSPIADAITGFAATEIEKVESMNSRNVLNKATVETMGQYMAGPMRSMLMETLRSVPPNVTLVFGHTHKPFERAMAFEGFGTPVKVYNTGGWAVQTTTPEKAHGASIVLVDDKLNVAGVRMFNEQHQPGDYQVRVTTADPENRNPLHDWLVEAIDPAKEPWSGFSSTLYGAMGTREQLVRQKIAGGKSG